MKIMHRNKRPFYYLLYKERQAILDANNYETGETKVVYYPAVLMRANVSAATGFAQTEQFGNLPNYDKVIVTDDMNCPIDENSVLFLDKAPEYDVADGSPKYDYTVKRVAKSLNFIAIAIEKVTVS